MVFCFQFRLLTVNSLCYGLLLVVSHVITTMPLCLDVLQPDEKKFNCDFCDAKFCGRSGRSYHYHTVHKISGFGVLTEPEFQQQGADRRYRRREAYHNMSRSRSPVRRQGGKTQRSAIPSGDSRNVVQYARTEAATEVDVRGREVGNLVSQTSPV